MSQIIELKLLGSGDEVIQTHVYGGTIQTPNSESSIISHNEINVYMDDSIENVKYIFNAIYRENGQRN